MYKKIILVLLFILYGCQKVTFDGNRIVNDDYYSLEYTVLNKDDIHTFSLHENDALDISISNLKGNLSIMIQDENKHSIYKGNDLKEAHFQVIIPKEGPYTLTVTGNSAQGEIVIQVKK